jgi:radical SAM protein with 4Fe4S-binding SPASM domain
LKKRELTFNRKVNNLNALLYFIKLVYWAGISNGFRIGFGLIKMHWRYFLIGRGRGLHKLLLLSTPMKVHIDPASACNFKCFFCPQSDPKALKEAGFPTTSMTLDLFTSLIDGLNEFPGRIDELVLGNYGEPLLNNQLSEMILYAKASPKIREVSLITNASLLKGDRLEKIASSGLDKIRISIEALSDEGYRETTGTKQRFTEIVENLQNFKKAILKNDKKTFIYTKIVDTGLSVSEKKRFFKTFAPISNAVSIENLMGVTKKAKEIIGLGEKGMTGVSLAKQRRVCPSPFYSLSIHSNGDVGVCCADWHHKTNIGSIKNKSLKSIWDSNELRSFRFAQLTKSWREIPACSGCEMIHHYPQYEDLDSMAVKILGKL